MVLSFPCSLLSFPHWALSCGQSGIHTWGSAPFNCSHHTEDRSPYLNRSHDQPSLSLSIIPSPANRTQQSPFIWVIVKAERGPKSRCCAGAVTSDDSPSFCLLVLSPSRPPLHTAASWAAQPQASGCSRIYPSHPKGHLGYLQLWQL